MEFSTERELSEYEIERNKPLPDFKHSIVQSNLIFELGSLHNKEFSFFSELNISMPTGKDAVPDISIYPKMKIDYSHDIMSMEEMPLTTIEISSPPQTEEDLIRNAKRYFDAGVKSCWVVLPIFKIIVIFSEPTKRKVFTSDMTLIDPATGIELPLGDIFS
jgi:Uma2 family endonuclease